jgi:16S rRNA (adenine(1408)-N(1))-methyltransferase
LNGKVDKLYVILPWGSLLKAIAQPDENVIDKFASILKSEGLLNVVFGYNTDLEPNQANKLDLWDIDDGYVKNQIIPVFAKRFALMNFKSVYKSRLKELESTWGKRISTRANRKIFELLFKKR